MVEAILERIRTTPLLYGRCGKNPIAVLVAGISTGRYLLIQTPCPRLIGKGMPPNYRCATLKVVSEGAMFLKSDEISR